MTEDELLENVKSLLRKAIASRLHLKRAAYEGSFETQTKVSRWLTNVMSIGYNQGDIDAVLEELCVARHYGNENDETVVEAMRKEVTATQSTLSSEIAAFAKMHALNQAKADHASTWLQIQAMVVLSDEYKA